MIAGRRASQAVGKSPARGGGGGGQQAEQSVTASLNPRAIRRTALRRDRRPLHDPSGSLFGSMDCKTGVRSAPTHRNIGPRKDRSPTPDLVGSSSSNKSRKLIEELRRFREPRSQAGAEVAIPRNLFADIPRLIAELRPPPVTSIA